MTRPEKEAPGPTAIGTRGQEKQQHGDFATAAADLLPLERERQRLILEGGR